MLVHVIAFPECPMYVVNIKRIMFIMGLKQVYKFETSFNKIA